MNPAWYAVRTVCRRELTIAEDIRRLGFPAWTPVVITEREPEKREVRRALLDGYVFTACGPFGFRSVAAVDGVVAFLRGLTPAGQRYPLALPENDLAPLMLAEACGAYDRREPDKPGLQRGDVVRITAGLWRGYLGQLLHQAGRCAVVEAPWGRLTLDPRLVEAA